MAKIKTIQIEESELKEALHAWLLANDLIRESDEIDEVQDEDGRLEFILVEF